MEHTMIIKLPRQVTGDAGAGLEDLLFEVLNANGEKIGYLIQDYYPREKVRAVQFERKEIRKQAGVFVAKATFTLEQFNVCAAIDTFDKSSMLMKVSIEPGGADLILSGDRVLD
jgi:hypothetical protein